MNIIDGKSFSQKVLNKIKEEHALTKEKILDLKKKTKEELISIIIKMQIDIQEERDEIYRRSLSDTLWG